MYGKFAFGPLRILRGIAFAFALITLWLASSATNLRAQLQLPVPAIAGAPVPASVPPGVYSAYVHLTGTGFFNVSVVNWNSVPIQTFFVSSTEIIGVVPQADLVSPTTGSITVTNPAPGGGTSNAVNFTVAVSPSAPTISNLLLPGGTNPGPPIMADFNGDGILDVAMVVDIINGAGISVQAGGINIQLGNGDGSFKNSITYPVAEGLLQPVSGDFNGDGNLDLVVYSFRSQLTYLLLGNGDGTFQAPLSFSGFGSPIVGDFNRDGKLDLILFSNSKFQLALGNGDGTFGTPADITPVLSVTDYTVADFNNDGKLDLAVLEPGQVSVYLGNGDGTFQPPVSTPSNLTNLLAAELNGDGLPDLVGNVDAAATLSFGFAVQLGKGDGTFQPEVDYAIDQEAGKPVVTDLNGDGKPDVLYSDGPGGSIAVFLGNGDGTFQTEFQFVVGSYPDYQTVLCLAGDFNKDGKTDLLLTAFRHPTAATLLMLLQGEFPALSYPVAVDFGQPVVGVDTTKTFTLQDTGLQNVTISSMVMSGLNSSMFVVSDDTCTGTTLVPSATCTFVMNYTPVTAAGHSAKLLISDNAIGNPHTVLLTGATDTGSGLVLSSSDVTFPSEPVGTPSPAQPVTVTSGGYTDLAITQIDITGINASDFTQTNTCTSFIPVGSTCQINFTFTPSDVGTRIATAAISYNGQGSPRTIYLTGNRLPGPQLLIIPSSLNFPVPINIVGSSLTLTLASAGTATVSISGITITGANPNNFLQTANTCGPTLTVNAGCQITILLIPDLLRDSSATLQIVDNSSSSPHLIPMTGPQARIPNSSTSPLSLTFASQALGTPSAAQDITVTSTGQLPLVVGGGFSGANPDDFNLVPSTCQGASVPPGATCKFSLNFAPSAIGTRTATFTILSNAPNSSETSPITLVSLTGTGVTATPPPIGTIAPLSLTFPAQIVGTASASQVVMVTNSGTSALVVSGSTFGGANPGDFNTSSSTCVNATLAAGQACQIAVSFSPAALGSRSATLNVSTNIPGGLSGVTLGGMGVAQPSPMATVAPSSLTFPSQFVGTSGLPQNVTLTNTGNVAISIASIAASPADFGQLNTCGTTLTVGASCSIGVFFDPTVSGARSGTLTITDGAGNSPQTVTLSGTGEDFSVAPAAAPTATVKAGQSATYMLNLSPGGGFSQAVTFSCSGAPAFSSCVVSPNPAMVTGSTVTATVTVTTTAASHIVPKHPNQWSEGIGKYPGMLLAAVLAALLLLLNEQRHKRRVTFSQASVALLCCVLITVAACGGGSSGGGNSPPGGSPTGTSAGSYTLTVTATYTTGTTALTHQTNLTLVVQ